MPESYPDDAALLALDQDPDTGVEYIPTGQSPYHLHFRRMLQRLLLAFGRANDLRVCRQGPLALTVRPGRCVIANHNIDFPGQTDLALAPASTTHLWLDAAGELHLSADAFPTDRSTFLPLAQVVTDDNGITSLTDIRGRAFLHAPSLPALGCSATVAEINRALAGATESVTSTALAALTAGPEGDADGLHRHTRFEHDLPGETAFSLINNSTDPAANIALLLGLPNRLPDDTLLLPSLDTGFLTQRHNGITYHLLGALPLQFRHQGPLAATAPGQLAGAAPTHGIITQIHLSLGANLVSTNPGDSIIALVKVNGVAIATTHPALFVADGPGFRSTAQGHGISAVLKTDGSANVRRGDIITIDLIRIVAGVVTTEAADVAAFILLRAHAPE